MRCSAETSTVFYYRLKYKQIYTSRGLDTPARVTKNKKGQQKHRLNKCKNSSNTRQFERVSIAAGTRRPEKTSPRLAQEIWVGTKVGYGCRALLLDP